MKICIDAGHGGRDPGAIGKQGDTSYYEKDINLTAAFMLAGVMHSYGHRAVMIRTEDETLSKEHRVLEANDVDCDLFVSVHCNSFQVDPNDDDTDAQIIEKAIRSSLPRGFEIYHYPNSEKGEMIAEEVLTQVSHIPWAYQHGDGNKSAKFYVLKYTTMPAILIELSYISNPDDLADILLTLPNLFTLIRVIGEAIDDKTG